MLSRTLGYPSTFGRRISQTTVFEKRIFAIGFLILCGALSVTGVLNGLSTYSPDSWAYYELSKTLFGGEFYRFNTYRSYFSGTYSASFPFGYPVLIAIGQLIIGETPLTAVAINIVAAVVTWALIIRLAKQINITPLSGFALACSLVLWTPYLDEVYSGRSIPVALLLFLISLSAYLSRRFLVGGLFLGFAALVRFDYLVYALLFQVAAGLFESKRRVERLGMLMAGFLFGVLPWVWFSETHFGRVWVTDNSWVTLSALPAYVLDFPAKVAIGLADNPAMWFLRIAKNVVPLTRSIAFSAARFPVLVFSSLFFLLIFLKLTGLARRHSLISFTVLAVSMSPYLVTGYFDNRYFALLFLCIAGVIVYSIESSFLTQNMTAVFNMGVLVSLLVCVGFGGFFLANRALSGMRRMGEPDLAAEQIETLNRCHQMTPKNTYIFMGEAFTLAPRYGATTGKRTAFIPSNFDRMSETDKRKYFDTLNPFTLISALPESNKCPQ